MATTQDTSHGTDAYLLQRRNRLQATEPLVITAGGRVHQIVFTGRHSQPRQRQLAQCITRVLCITTGHKAVALHTAHNTPHTT